MDKEETTQEQFGDLGSIIPGFAGEGWRAFLRVGIEFLLGLPQIRNVMQQAADKGLPNQTIFTSLLKEMQISLEGNQFQLPQTGSCIVIANHPYGGIDALALASLCCEQRKDTLIFANQELGKLPGISKWILPLNILSGKEAARNNLISLKKAHEHLTQGGVLTVFPAGAVSRWSWDHGDIRDPEWSSHIASFIHKSKAPVLPVCFLGHNPPWFLFFGELSPLIRTVLIPRAFLSTKRKLIQYRVGKLTQFEHFTRNEVLIRVRSLVENLRF